MSVLERATRHALYVAAVIVPSLLVTARAEAQDASPRWQFYFTPYLWVSGITGTTSTRNPTIPSQTATASFGDLLSHLNSVPVMGAAEIRYERFGLLADLMVVSLKSNVATQDMAFTGGSAKVTQLISTVMPSYRVVEETNRSLDVGLGTRIVGIWTTLSFNPGLLPGFSRSASVSWARPLFGVRYHLGLNEQWGLTAYGDVGGLSAGSRTWQLLGTVDYQYNDWLVFHAGYRHLHINYQGDVLRSSTALTGPILGSTIRF